MLLSLLLIACAPSEGEEPGDCSDLADNDGDGMFDCEDDGCAGSPECSSEEADADTDTDTDADTDADTDTDTDADTDADADADTDADTDADIEPCNDASVTGEINGESVSFRSFAWEATGYGANFFGADYVGVDVCSLALSGDLDNIPRMQIKLESISSGTHDVVSLEDSKPGSPRALGSYFSKGFGAGANGGSVTINALSQPDDAEISNVTLSFTTLKGESLGELTGDITACYCEGLDQATQPGGGKGGGGGNGGG